MAATQTNGVLNLHLGTMVRACQRRWKRSAPGSASQSAQPAAAHVRQRLRAHPLAESGHGRRGGLDLTAAGRGLARVSERQGKLRPLVVDDEPLARRNLTVLLGRDPDIGPSRNAAREPTRSRSIRDSRPDPAVSWTCRCPSATASMCWSCWAPDMPRRSYLVTAHDHYALRAFEAGALELTC